MTRAVRELGCHRRDTARPGDVLVAVDGRSTLQSRDFPKILSYLNVYVALHVAGDVCLLRCLSHDVLWTVLPPAPLPAGNATALRTS